VKETDSNAGENKPTSSPSYQVKCTHKDYISLGGVIDFSELWNGATERRSGVRWGGGFSARPGLADDLFDAIKAVALNKSPNSMRCLLSILRNFWRFLDAYEDSLSSSERISIDSVSKIDSIIGLRWLRPMTTVYAPAYLGEYNMVHTIVKISLLSRGLAPVYWPPATHPPTVSRKDTPSIKEGITIVRLLTKKAHEIWARWERADALAASGRVLDSKFVQSNKKFDVVEADIHATYRELIRCTGNPTPSFSDLFKFIGLVDSWMPKWWPERPDAGRTRGRFVNLESDLLPGLYPTFADLSCLSTLLMARSGWNVATTVGLDCSNSENWNRPYGDGLIWIYSYKDRARSWQDTISPENHAGHSYQIITRLLKRNEILRKSVTEDPEKCGYPDLAQRSPWVCALNSNKVGVLGNHSLSTLRRYLERVVQEYNNAKEDALKLPIFRPSDFRDVFAEAVHRGGNYSIFLTQIALGHKNLASTRRYLRSVAWRKESEFQLNSFVTALFEQIEIHRKIDITVLRAKMDGVNITQEHIDRLETYRKNKTYSGLYCSDPSHPPEWIDPKNPRDGSEICQQGHRCPSCPKGKVFEDSLEHIARYTAELEWRRENVGDLRWYQSTDCLDLEVYRETLKQWAVERVEIQVAFWREKINSGEHQVLIYSSGVQ